ncbi:MAG TPA: type II toxin-antitoxin system prevent-host-death family antitoxin [Deltaproteobacteria bacterium]|nr:type II toxin-antitoxin system prevent-host-death family antitoxin [Deltaproteobacteria bacterium]HQI81502.1 type II toxin-antitoxin system prevent-host-death family antitoxin [Deltaproteobacteria bacterium]
MKKSTTVSAFDAKTHLSRLLQEVENGASIIITRRGKPVACLTQPTPTDEEMSRKDVLNQFDALRRHVRGRGGIRQYIAQGRKY